MASGSSAGNFGVKAMHNPDVPCAQHTETAMVEIIAPATAKRETAPLDLVVVLDTSGSMKGEKLRDMKMAMDFIIMHVLKSGDKLAIVPFASTAEEAKAYKLQYMDSKMKPAAKAFVDKLPANGNTNIQAGLKTATDILSGPRGNPNGRAQGIFLMSDGHQNHGDARQVDVGGLPVFTYGFGKDHDEKLLDAIATKSHGGIYNYVKHPVTDDTRTLTVYFAKALGILRHITALNVTVTLKPQAGAKILLDPAKAAGKWPVTPASNGSFTIRYGEMARYETRTIIFDIQLPAVPNNESAKTFVAVEIKYQPATETGVRTVPPYNIQMARKQGARLRTPTGHFATELARRDQAQRIEKMKDLADGKKLDQAREEVDEARDALANVEHTEHTEHLHDALFIELRHIEEMLESHEAYTSHGRPYILAAILSHGRQRFAARGGDDDIMLFVLPRMRKNANRAVDFHRNNANARA